METSTTTNLREYTFSIKLANHLALPLGIVLALTLYFPFRALWQPSLTDGKIFTTMSGSIGGFFAIFFGLIVLHELLHGITAAHYSTKGWKSVKFGFMWRTLTPYCHCSEPLKRRHYQLVCIMPLLVLGIAPIIIAFATGFLPLLMWGILLSSAAIGDIILVVMSRKIPRDAMITDHPDTLGFFAEQ